MKCSNVSTLADIARARKSGGGCRDARKGGLLAPERDAEDRLHRPIELPEMTIYDVKMDISVTDFKARCLDLIRRVERTGKPLTIKRRGKTVARLEPARSLDPGLKPWEQLRVLGGEVHAAPGESVIKDEDFESLR